MKLELVQKTLQITGKTIDDISDIDTYQKGKEYSIEKLFYYLISKEFCKAVIKIAYTYPEEVKSKFIHGFLHKITVAMVEYKEGNEERLTNLLETICNTQNQK